MASQIKTRIMQKYDSEANWKLATNFKPMRGEIITYSPDDDYSYPRIKIGDGVSYVNELPFITVEAGANLGLVKTGGDVTISDGTITVNDDSHAHVISNIDNLQNALDSKLTTTELKVTTSGSGNAVTSVSYDSDTKTITLTKGATYNNYTYTLPVAGTSLGGIKSGGDITINTSGVVSVNDNSHKHTLDNISDLNSIINQIDENLGAAKTYTNEKVAELVDSSPDTLNTLNELAAALGDDPNFATTVATEIGKKANQTSLDSHINNKNNPHAVSLSQLGVTASTTSLNQVDITEPLQAQLTNLNDSKASKDLATSTASGLMSANDKKHLTALTTTNLGSLNGKTIADLRSSLENWLSSARAYVGASCYVIGASWINSWNNEDLTTVLEGGSYWTFTVRSYYHADSYVLLEINTYGHKSSWYVARVNNVWGRIYKTAFTDQIPTLSSMGITASPTELNILDGVTTSTAEINHLKGVTSNVQTQLTNLNDGKASKDVATTSADGLMSSTDKTKLDGIADGANKTIVDTALSSTSTNPVQNKVINSALSGKQATITGGASTIVSDNLIANRVLISNGSGKVIATAVTNTELGYLSGVTSGIQAQLTNLSDGKAPNSHASNTSTYGISTAALYGHAMATSTTPKANGTAALGSEVAKFARGDHVHPLQTTVSGNAGTATKLATARSIALGTGATGAANFDGSANITIPVTSVKEAYLSWGGKNFSGSFGPVDAAMIPILGANRFAFGRVNTGGVTVEYSTDGGTTWLDYGATEQNLAKFFSTGNTFIIGKNTTATTEFDNLKLRITIDTTKFYLYGELTKFAIYASSNGSANCYCTIETSKGDNPTTFNILGDASNVPISGWSGWNIINVPKIRTVGNNTQALSTKHHSIRFTFGASGYTHTGFIGLGISKILAFGGEAWTTPSNMATEGHLYKYDEYQNATFPAKISSQSLETSSLQTRILKVPGTSGGTDYGLGISGQVLSTNGSSVYWKTLDYLPLSGGTLTGRLTINTTIKDQESPIKRALVITSTEVPDGTTLTDKNAPGIGFHISSNSWGSLIYRNSSFRFVNNASTGYQPVYASKFYGDLEGNATTASGVAWSGITSKPSYYDAKAIKSISRSGTTFTYTCLDDTTGTFTQQDTDTGATSVEVTGSGNAITAASYDASTRKLTLTKGATYNNYSLPAATTSARGGVIVGSNITVNNGTISLTKANVTTALGYTPPTTDTNVTQTLTETAAQNTNWYLLAGTSASTTTAGTVFTQDARIQSYRGTTSAQGEVELILGNNVAKGTATNKEGFITLYSPGTSYHQIKGTSTSSAIIHTLPATTGTILNTGTISTWLSNNASTVRSNIGAVNTAGDTITGTLILSRATDASGTADNKPALIIGSSSGEHIEADANEIMAKSSETTTSTLYLNSDGGQVVIGTGGLKIKGTSSYSTTLAANTTSTYLSYINSSGTTINKLDLWSDHTSLLKPLDISSGGSGATTASGALYNFGIRYSSTAPENPWTGMIWLEPIGGTTT